MTETVLREFASSDIDWLVDAHADLYARDEGFDETFGPLVRSILEAFAASHDPSCEQGWIATRDGRPVGSIFCVRLNGTHAKLRLFLLLPTARGLGLGKLLLETCMKFAQAKGYAGMELWTHESHKAACALYQKAGWDCVAAEPVHSFGVDLVEQTWRIDF